MPKSSRSIQHPSVARPVTFRVITSSGRRENTVSRISTASLSGVRSNWSNSHFRSVDQTRIAQFIGREIDADPRNCIIPSTIPGAHRIEGVMANDLPQAVPSVRPVRRMVRNTSGAENAFDRMVPTCQCLEPGDIAGRPLKVEVGNQGRISPLVQRRLELFSQICADQRPTSAFRDRIGAYGRRPASLRLRKSGCCGADPLVHLGLTQVGDTDRNRWSRIDRHLCHSAKAVLRQRFGYGPTSEYRLRDQDAATGEAR